MRQYKRKKVVIEEILQHQNIKLFSFNNLTEITTDLNNYKDTTHYGEWINSLILKYMHDGKYRLTSENYEAYLKEEERFYTTFDINKLKKQEDYEDDFYAAFLLAEETYDLKRKEISLSSSDITLSNAALVEDQFEGKPGILCKGTLQRKNKDKKVSIDEYIYHTEFIGFGFEIQDIEPVQYIAFNGRKVRNHGQPTVYIYDKSGNVIAQLEAKYKKLDNEWHQYYIDVSELSGYADLFFNGAYTDNSGSKDSEYVFSNVMLLGY